ncbi:hypothetical protein AM629_19430 [Photorhabdus heterorhabditis]|uniref:Uncharacterized protein n=1 Tax=Photorhabdus heterorhabditis TaxID=880156 RepID=A0ABR5K7B4_9GAMM|nr:hypothetical protein [Photorhabdus heterorhabditis]KOY60438.1 hypothetical protein AM629_19430 [Photorhabdus heterorhabditis]
MSVILNAKQIKDIAEYAGFSIEEKNIDWEKKYEICYDTIPEFRPSDTVEYNGLVIRNAEPPHCAYPLVEYEVICTECFKEMYPLDIFGAICHSCRTANNQ